MEELLLSLAAMLDPLYVVIWCVGCLIFTVVAPPKLTAKIPDVIMQVINFSAFNWGNAVNRYCDSKGNPCDDSKDKDSNPDKKSA